MASLGVNVSVRTATHKFAISKRLMPLGGSIITESNRKMSSNFMKHYASVPPLPVPKLEQTLTKYLRTLKPLTTPADYAASEQAVKEFIAPGSVGEKLHNMLVEKGSKEENWLSQWWLDVAYLAYRLPVVVHSSPGLVFPKQEFSSVKDQLVYAGKVIAGALQYKKVIDEAKLKQDYLGKSPLCMSQYTRVFSGCRIPALPKDSPHQCPDSKHIIVAHNNHFFKVQVIDEDGQIIPTSLIVAALQRITAMSDYSADPIGILTTEHRDTWAVVNSKLKKDAVNAASLKAIEDSIFVMCLDKLNNHVKMPEDMSPKSRMACQLLHGWGSDSNSGNRWFDKTLQLIVGRDGTNGLCYEHSPAEGPPMANLSDFVVDFAAKESVAGDVSSSWNGVGIEQLSFNLTADLVKDIESAKRNMDALVADVDMNCFSFDPFGKEDIKALKFSPDSFIQVALQTAFIRTHGHPVGHYESASTRKFAYGRTDTIRSCLPEIAGFAFSLLDPSKSPKEKYASLRAAIQAHKDYVQAAVDGQGIDRHLLGMKLLAVENGINVPSLYTDPSYSKSCNWRVSTSQVAVRNDMVLVFGPVVTDGYGSCYNPRNDNINFMVTAFNQDPTTSAKRFGDALQASLLDMRNLAAANMPSNL